MKQWEELRGSPGWQLFLQAVENNRRQIVKTIFARDSHGLDGAIEDAKDKSYLAGVQAAASFPALWIETLKDEMEELLLEMRSLEDEE